MRQALDSNPVPCDITRLRVLCMEGGGQDPSEGGKNASGRWLVVLIFPRGLQGAPAWDHGTP